MSLESRDTSHASRRAIQCARLALKVLDSEATALISSIHTQISQLAVKRFSQMNLASELQLQRCALMFCCVVVVVVLGVRKPKQQTKLVFGG